MEMRLTALEAASDLQCRHQVSVQANLDKVQQEVKQLPVTVKHEVLQGEKDMKSLQSSEMKKNMEEVFNSLDVTYSQFDLILSLFHSYFRRLRNRCAYQCP
jgi:hypothetical protein